MRLPRVLVGFVAGGALAVAGAALQGLFRNPLAEPGVLGISSGASLGAVLAIYFHVAGTRGLAAARLRVRGRGGRRACWCSPSRRTAGGAGVFTATLLLVGVAMMSLNVSLTTFVLSMSLAQLRRRARR